MIKKVFVMGCCLFTQLAQYAMDQGNLVQEGMDCAVRSFSTDSDQLLLEKIMSKFGSELDCTLEYVISYTGKKGYVTETLDVAGKPAGFINYSSDDPENLAELNEPHGFIHLVAIDNLYQGSGLGKKLCSLIVEKLRSCGIKTVILYVKDWNHKAQNLYYSLGFKLKRIDANEQCLLLELSLA